MNRKFSHHITTLLRRHDCVIVPGVGAFVATHMAAARIGDTMTPPRRSISFNPAMVHDDGLLADSLSRQMKISFEQARERVAAESALIQRRLRAEGAVSIARVGTLRRLKGGRLEFTPFDLWTLPLPTVKIARPLPAFEVVKPAASTEAEQKRVAVVRVPLRLQWLRVAAAAVVLCLIGFTLSTPIDIDTAQNASLAAPAFTPPEEPAIEPLPVPADMELNLAMAPADGAFTPTKPEPPRRMNYVMVVASLPSRAKALEFIAQSGMPNLDIMQSGENFRVFAAAGATQEEARAAAAAIDGFSSRFPDAWICRR